MAKVSSWHFRHLLQVVWLKKACKRGGHGHSRTPLATPMSYTVVNPHGKIRRNRVQIRLTAAPPTDVKIFISQYTGSQTEHSDSIGDIAPPAQPLRLTNGPKPPLNQGLRSLQEEPLTLETNLPQQKAQAQLSQVHKPSTKVQTQQSASQIRRRKDPQE